MAAPTRAEFRDLHPEFNACPDAIVQAALDEAALDTPEGLWEERHFAGVRWLAAELLAQQPNAKELRLKGTDATFYTKRRADLAALVHTGPLVVGRW
jgi:hypothetical protein